MPRVAELHHSHHRLQDLFSFPPLRFMECPRICLLRLGGLLKHLQLFLHSCDKRVDVSRQECFIKLLHLRNIQRATYFALSVTHRYTSSFAPNMSSLTHSHRCLSLLLVVAKPCPTQSWGRRRGGARGRGRQQQEAEDHDDVPVTVDDAEDEIQVDLA